MKWLFIILGLLALIIGVVYLLGSLMPVKHRASVEGKFGISAEEMWAILTNHKDYKNWRKGIKELIMNGSHEWTEQNNHGDKVNYRAEWVEPSKTLITRITNKDLPYGGYWEFNIKNEPGGCSVQITENGEVYNPIFRFMSKYIFGHDATLKGYLEDLNAKVVATKTAQTQN